MVTMKKYTVIWTERVGTGSHAVRYTYIETDDLKKFITEMPEDHVIDRNNIWYIFENHVREEGAPSPNPTMPLV